MKTSYRSKLSRVKVGATAGTLILLLVSSSDAVAAQRQEIPASSGQIEALLGGAYQSEKEAFVGDQCLEKGVISLTGTATGHFSLESAMSESMLSSELGFGVGGRFRSGVVSVSAAARFLRDSTSNNLSVSTAWSSGYTFPVQKIAQPALNAQGTALLLNPKRWAETCGDMYVNEIVRGAKLFFSIRVDFVSEAEKQRFEAKFSVSGPMAAVNADFKTASTSFSRNTRVTVSGYQVGGDVSKLTAVLSSVQGTGTEAGKSGFIECTLGKFEKCAEVIERAVQYASDVEKGFPSQLAQDALPGAAVLAYRVTPYTAINIYPKDYPGLEQATILARQEVSNAFEKNFRLAVTAERLLKQKDLEQERRLLIQGEKAKADQNIAKILEVSEVCYDSPVICWKTMDNQFHKAPGLIAIDEKVFLPPTLETYCEIAQREQNAKLALWNTISKIREQLNLEANDSCRELGLRAVKIQELNLDSNGSSIGAIDLRPVATLGYLEKLHASHAKIEDLTPLSNLVFLKSLNLQNNLIRDVEPIADLKSLLTLDLSQNFIEDVSTLGRLSRLQYLDLQENNISNVEAFKQFPRMIDLDLRLNPLTNELVNQLRGRLPTGTLVHF